MGGVLLIRAAPVPELPLPGNNLPTFYYLNFNILLVNVLSSIIVRHNEGDTVGTAFQWLPFHFLTLSIYFPIPVEVPLIPHYLTIHIATPNCAEGHLRRLIFAHRSVLEQDIINVRGFFGLETLGIAAMLLSFNIPIKVSLKLDSPGQYIIVKLRYRWDVPDRYLLRNRVAVAGLVPYRQADLVGAVVLEPVGGILLIRAAPVPELPLPRDDRDPFGIHKTIVTPFGTSIVHRY